MAVCKRPIRVATIVLLDDSPTPFVHDWFEDWVPSLLECRQCSYLVRFDKMPVADHVGNQNGREAPRHCSDISYSGVL